MSRAVVGAAFFGLLVGCTSGQSCTDQGGTCASVCPNGTQEVTGAQLAAVEVGGSAKNLAYACPGSDESLQGLSCCLPIPATN